MPEAGHAAVGAQGGCGCLGGPPSVVEQRPRWLKPGRELHANVEFYAGVVMKVAGLEPAMFTPTFCVARMVGWT
ncbi:citrate/2-methylcitrate synthase, partial [Intrasporangium sp.]|uniref:citrate/2-methylcitrate synthase n=1 Tax=Intrasporangium sp. TaxID=1925024 RepID=UPI003365A864